MKENKKLTASFLEAEKVYRAMEKKIEKYFKKQVDTVIEEATTLEQLQEVKEFLRNMPQISGKVFLFRDIIMKEDELKKSAEEKL